MWCSFTADVLPCHLQWYCGGMGWRTTRIVAWFEGFDLIIETMFPGLRYTGHSSLSPHHVERCVCCDLPNTGTIVAPSGRRRFWSSHNHRSYDKIELMYLFIPPPVAWFHLWVDTFLSIIEFLCWSMRHTFPERRLLHEKLNAFDKIAVREMCEIIVAIVIWIGQTIIKTLPDFKSWCQLHRTFCWTCWIECAMKWSFWRLPW